MEQECLVWGRKLHAAQAYLSNVEWGTVALLCNHSFKLYPKFRSGNTVAQTQVSQMTARRRQHETKRGKVRLKTVAMRVLWGCGGVVQCGRGGRLALDSTLRSFVAVPYPSSSTTPRESTRPQEGW